MRYTTYFDAAITDGAIGTKYSRVSEIWVFCVGCFFLNHRVYKIFQIVICTRTQNNVKSVLVVLKWVNSGKYVHTARQNQYVAYNFSHTFDALA